MKRGRPTRYDPAFARQARLLCRLGTSNADLAKVFSVSSATLYRWLDRYPDFGLAVAIGRGEHAGLEKPGMYKRATGYSFRTERIYRANSTNPVAADYDYRVHADAKVALRWLRNRQPETWRIGASRRGKAIDRLTPQPEPIGRTSNSRCFTYSIAPDRAFRDRAGPQDRFS